MTRQQIENVCRHFGLSEWADEFCRLVIDHKIEDRGFGRFIRCGRGKRCLEIMKTILSESVTRECFDVYPETIADLDSALAIANSP